MVPILWQIDVGNGYENVINPRNAKDVIIEALFNSQTPSISIQNTVFEFVGNACDKIHNYLDQCKQGSKSIWYGLPLKVTVGTIGIDLLIELAHENFQDECDVIYAPIKMRGKKDWLDDIAAGIVFSYLASIEYAAQLSHPGLIDPITDYKLTPYAISEIPDYTTAMTLLFDEAVIIYELEQELEKVIKRVVELVFSIGASAAIVGAVINLLFELVKFAAVLVALIQTTKELINNIIQRKKYKKCMREVDIWRKIAEYAGLTFSSTIYASGSQFENATDMPRKIVMPTKNSWLGGLTGLTFDRPFDEDTSALAYGHPDGTAKEWIEYQITKYNAEIVVNNGVLYFEEKHFWDRKNPYKVPNTDEIKNTFNLPDPHGTNAHELPPSMFVEFLIDESELNTIHYYEGTTVSYLIQSKVKGDIKNKSLSEGMIYTIPRALAKRKEYLTRPEDILSDLINAVNAAIQVTVDIANLQVKAVNAIIKLHNKLLPAKKKIKLLPLLQPIFIPNVFDDRIGWMLLSNDSFSIPKTFIGEVGEDGDWEIAPQSETVMSANNLAENFHANNLGTKNQTTGFQNQYYTYRGRKIKFCETDFAQIASSNVLVTHDNKYGKFEAIKWNQTDETAEVDYRIESVFDNSLEVTKVIDGNDPNRTGAADSLINGVTNG